MTAEERQTALHEAGHATACMVLRLPVKAVRRWSPFPDELGATVVPRLGEDLDKDKARRLCKMLLCGPIMADEPIPAWPLSRTNTNDEALLDVLTHYLGLDELGYSKLVTETLYLTCEDQFVRTFEALTGIFEHTPTIDADLLAAASRIGRLT